MAKTSYKLNKQPELMDVPKSLCDEAAETYVGMLEEQEELKERIASQESLLIEELKKAGRFGINLRGRTITVVTTMAKIKLAVKKAKSAK